METVVKRKPDGTIVALVVGHKPRDFPTKQEVSKRGKLYAYACKRGIAAAAKKFKCSPTHVYNVLDWYEKYLAAH